MDYRDRVKQQIDQYADISDMHAQLSSITDYWKRTYMSPHFNEVTGMSNYIEFYAKPFADRISKTGEKNLVSLGSGDGALEVMIAKKMKALGCDDFIFNLVELSPAQISRAKDNIKNAGLIANFNTIEADFNEWTADITYSGVMAHHALHHVLELEHLFEAIKAGLHPEGVFVSFDMIGRNGHMRWPEALEFIERIWKFLPPEKKYHHLLKTDFDEFYNHDCSNQGFEGIRSQDILPLLVKYFNFEIFFAYGNITDEFINRAYGPNYDPENVQDVALIDFIEYLNNTLIDVGYIKPTKMAAAMTLGPVENPKYFRNWSPEFCVRVVEN